MSIIQELLKKDIFIEPGLLDSGVDEALFKKAYETYGDDLLVIDKELIDKIKKQQEQKQIDRKVKVVWTYDKPAVKRTYDHFVKSLQIRFKGLESILRTRQELANCVSISRIKTKQERESVSCIGLIQEKQITPNGHIILTIEDMSASTKVLISKNNEDLLEIAKDLQLDEVIGITGKCGSDIVFAESIIFPDVPLTKELKKGVAEEYIIFIGDIEFGGEAFLKKEFERFLLWVNGKVGNEEQKAIAKKIKYCVIIGDVVDGIGIYPGQENDLTISDITQQYEEAARYLSQIPEHITMIIIPGNHDAGRLTEPQEPLLKQFASSLYDLPNVIMLSNPSMITIGETKTFPGFDILLYHGGSLTYYADNIPSVRSAGGQKRSDLIMKFYLQRRHLAPTHKAALTIPDAQDDYLLIRKVPDFLITGHIHRVSVSNYRNVTMINSSCWSDITDNQIKRGLEPQPGRVVLTNLRTRKTQIMNFYKGRADASK